MNRILFGANFGLFSIVLTLATATADEPVVFDDFFHDKALRLELFSLF